MIQKIIKIVFLFFLISFFIFFSSFFLQFQSTRNLRPAQDITLFNQSIYSKPFNEQIIAINDYVNQNISYETDTNQFNTLDYWQTPIETLTNKKGDCEDYAILKYALLKKQGISSYLAYARQIDPVTSKIQSHLVNYVLINDQPYILDNLSYRILTPVERRDLSIIFIFNDHEILNYPTLTPASSSVRNLSQWNRMIQSDLTNF